MATTRRSVVLAAGTEKEEVVDDYVQEYCSIDPATGKKVKKTLGQMEAEFLDAMRSYYYDGQATMSNEEFDNLKQELLWEGSTVVVLSEAEQKFLEASMAYNAGKPIMADADYDKLKKELKQQNSTVAAGGPRCSLRSGKMYSDASVDYTKMLALNIPAVFIVLGAVFATDFASGFSLSKLIESPGLAGNLFLWTVLLPGIYVLSSSLTNLIIRDGVILTSKCANCGHVNNAYFGDIIIVEGAKGSQELECESCKSLLKWDNDAREVEVSRVGPAAKA